MAASIAFVTQSAGEADGHAACVHGSIRVADLNRIGDALHLLSELVEPANACVRHGACATTETAAISSRRISAPCAPSRVAAAAAERTFNPIG